MFYIFFFALTYKDFVDDTVFHIGNTDFLTDHLKRKSSVKLILA